MPPRRTVKAREHHGAKSVDLTLPKEVCEECDVRPGDVFSVSADCGVGERLVVTYTRVFASER